jgi:integrase/recombinase XerC
MALGKQAKILTDKQVRAVLAELDTRRYPLRDRTMFMLSLKAGMRAKEVASVTWGMVTDAEGQIGDVIALENKASKGRTGGRHSPIHPDLKAALIQLHRDRGDKARPDMPVIHSERDRGLSAAAVVVWFHRLYGDLGMVGCSSHSGRRSFITRAARKISEVGGSLRDVQQLAGHASLGTTARYIEAECRSSAESRGSNLDPLFLA